MADIFLSYAREDVVRAESIAAALEAAGFSVWWDRNLTAGERYSEETESHLKRAKAVLVLWTRASVVSNWVRDEAGVGRDADRLVPLSFDGVDAPIGFRQIQALAADDSGGRLPSQTFELLVRALRRKLSHEASDPPRPATEPAANKGPDRRRWLAPLAIACAAALVAAASLLPTLFKNGGSETDRAAEIAPGAKLTVPPFELNGADERLGGLAAGLTHGMRAMLRERGFDVRGYQYPESADAAREFIDRLGVDYVVRGTIAEIGGALLYNVDIIRTRNESAVASFQMQEESAGDVTVVRSILDRVAASLAPDTPAGGEVPENSDYYVALGLIEDAASRADFEAARVLLKRATEKEPDNAHAQALYAYALASIDRYVDDAARSGDMSMAAINRAFAAGGADSDAYFARAVHHYVYGDDFGRFERAADDLEQAIKADPGNMRALKWLMTVQIQQGDYAGAIDIADRALSLSPDYRDVQGNRISALLSLGRRDEARATLDKLLEETPDWAWGRRFRASMALTDGDFARAREEVDRAEALDPVSWNADIMTIIEARSGGLESAYAAIDLQARRSGLDPEWVTYKKSIIGGDIGEAQAALERLVAREVRPRQRAQALVALGFVHLYGREPGPAQAACDESVSLIRDDVNLNGPPELAEVCAAIADARLGDDTAARRLIMRFERTRPARGLYRPYWTESLLAALLAETGDVDRALDTIEQIIAQGWRTPNTALCRHCVHLSVEDGRGLYFKLANEPRFKTFLATMKPQSAAAQN